jgi:hypothetical protein
MQIFNTTLHPQTSLVADPFGDSGAIRLVPCEGDQPGRALIIDADAAAELARFILELQA